MMHIYKEEIYWPSFVARRRTRNVTNSML